VRPAAVRGTRRSGVSAEFFPASVVLRADGSEVLTIDFFGIPLVWTFDASGAQVGFRI
jgi:hypothetical protein